MKTTGELIKQYRQSMNMSMNDLSMRTGIVITQLHRYERNERKPKFEVLAKIAYALKVPVECLLSEFYTLPQDEVSVEQEEIYEKRVEFMNNLLYELWTSKDSLSEKQQQEFYNFVKKILDKYKVNQLEETIKLISSRFLSDEDLVSISDYARNELGITDAPKSFDDI